MSAANALKRLLPSGARLLTPEFTRGETTYEERECADVLEEHSVMLSLGALDVLTAEAIERFEVGDPAADAFLAESVHRALPLSRRDAADPGVFRYLSVIRYPHLVRHRWEFRSYSAMRSRFWSTGARHDSNAFSRWWWGAELTRDGDDYSLTSRVFGRSVLATHVLNRTIASHRPAILAIVDELETTPGPLVLPAIANLGKMLSVRVVESLSHAELRRLVRDALSLAKRLAKA